MDLPSPRDLDLTEIKLEAGRYVTRILGNWTTLNGYLKRFELIIQRRWLKKTTKQRREILLTAWPQMSRDHRPDFVGYRNKKAAHRRVQAATAYKRSQAFLWPYINLEDLLQGHLLPLFLKSRGREFPAAFVTSDLGNAHRGNGWPKEVNDGNAGIVFANGKTPRTYGRVTIQEGGISQSVTRPVYPPITGLFILEVQDGIYNFLLACTQAIMHDIDAHTWYISPSMPEPFAPAAESKRGAIDWSNLPGFVLEAPYRGTHQLDLDRLQTLVSARRIAAEDHIWLMREDPAYFLESLKDTIEHSLEPLAVTRGATHAWEHAAGALLANAFCSFLLWDDVELMLAQLPCVEMQLRHANAKTGRLCSQHECWWAYLDTIIEHLIWVPLGLLGHGMPLSPRIRVISHFDVEKSTGNITWEMKPNRTDAEYRIYVLFWALFHKEQTDLHGRSSIVQEIQHVIDTESEVADLLDPWVIEKFADLALLCEFQRIIETFQPWVRGWRIHKVAYEGPDAHAVDNALSRDNIHSTVLNEAPCRASTELGIPIDGRFDYPADKKRTQETTSQMRSAERKLNRFWEEISDYFFEETDHYLWTEFKTRAQRTEGMRKTPKWVEPAPKEELVEMPTPTTPMNPLRQVDMNVWDGTDSDNKKREVLDAAKLTKTKVRRDPIAAYAEPPSPQRARAEVVVDEPEEAPEPIVLPKRIYKVFAAMLPSSDIQERVRREVAWDELLYAFNHIGLQPEKLYGSVWVFKPLPKGEGLVDMGRAITFHEPKEVR